jgi:flagellar basal-body rod protein FlgG
LLLIAENSVIKQGYLEGSNVNPVQNLVKLIAAQRQYESAVHASKSQDQSMDVSSNRIGLVRA